MPRLAFPRNLLITKFCAKREKDMTIELAANGILKCSPRESSERLKSKVGIHLLQKINMQLAINISKENLNIKPQYEKPFNIMIYETKKDSATDIDSIAETFKDMEKFSMRQKILVFLPGVIITSWILYQYYYVINYSSV